jgi:hypothetical protein
MKDACLALFRTTSPAFGDEKTMSPQDGNDIF